MKIRNGFVSNSSSSSFVIVGVPYQLDEITPAMFKGVSKRSDYKGSFVGIADQLEGSEATVYVYITSMEMLEFIKENNDKIGMERVYKILVEGGEGEIDISKVKMPEDEKVVVVGGTMDQSSPDSIETLNSYYLNYND